MKMCRTPTTMHLSNIASISGPAATLLAGLVIPYAAMAQQVFADGTSQVASGTINTGVLPPPAGYGLYALNNGIITSFSPLSVFTGGVASDAAHAQSGGSITLFGGSSVSTTGNIAVGLLATGSNSVVNATDTGVLTLGNNSPGVEAIEGGTVNITGGSVTTSGSMSYGLFASQANSTVRATNVTISTTGGAGYGARANPSGHILLNGGSIRTTGNGADGLITIDATAAIDASNVVIHTSGATASGANAFFGRISLDNAAVTTIGDGSHGARVDNAGSMAVTGGSFLTSGPSSFGLLAAAGSTLTSTNARVATSGASGIGASAQFGSQLTLNGGEITTSGASAAGLFAVGLGPAFFATPVLLDDTATPTAGTGASITANGVSVSTSGSGSHGASVRGGSSVALNNSTLAVFGVGGAALYSSAYDVGTSIALISGSTLSSAQGPGIRTSGTTLNATFLGSSVTGNPNFFEVVANGSLNLLALSSTFSGAAVTDAGSTSNVILQNATTWKLTGNSNVSTLINDTSLIEFSPPNSPLPTGFTTLTAVNYVGQQGTVGLNTYLGADASPSDRLVINGGTAAGNSMLRVANTTGLGALTTGNGILVVDATNGGATTAGAFSLNGPVVAGPYEYSLYRGSRDGSSAQSWYLRSDFVPVPPTPPPPDGGGGAILPPSPPAPPAIAIPDYRRETSLYAALPAMGLIYGRTIIDSLHERVGSQYSDATMPNGMRSSAGLGWARIIGVHGNQDGGRGGIFRGGPNFDYDIYALQAGLDLYRGENADGSRDHAGLYAAIGRIQGDVRHFRMKAGTNTIDGYTLGAYWTHFGASGWYLDSVVQGTWFEAEADSKRLIKLQRDGFGFGASLEGGYPFDLGQGWTIEPQAQLVYQTLVNSSGTDGAALVRFSDVDSIAGRVGARIAKRWALDEGSSPRMVTISLKASLWNEFLGNPKTSFSSETGKIAFRSDLGGTWLEATAGVDASITRNAALYASAGYSVGIDGRSHAYNGKVGLRVSW